MDSSASAAGFHLNGTVVGAFLNANLSLSSLCQCELPNLWFVLGHEPLRESNPELIIMGGHLPIDSISNCPGYIIKSNFFHSVR